MRHEELPGDVAGSDPHESQLHYTPPHIVRERPTIDEDSSKLINSGLTFKSLLVDLAGKRVIPPVWGILR